MAKKRILITEDNAMNMELSIGSLVKEGYTFTEDEKGS